MSQHVINSSDLQEIKEQFKLINNKLNKQSIINEEILHTSMTRKLSHIEKWYRLRFLTMLATPIISIVFLAQFYNNGFVYWGFFLLIIMIGLLEFFLYRKAYRILDIKNLSALSMTQATENIAKHKHLQTLANKILALPMVLLVIWTVLIATRFTWNLPIIALTVFTLGISIALGLHRLKKNRERLDEVLEQIKKLRE